MTLTLEQIAEGRRLVGPAKAEGATVSAAAYAEDWLLEHAEALLDAAERVARQEAYAETDAAFVRNELVMAERLAGNVLAREARSSARLDGETHCIDELEEPSEAERDAIIDATFKHNPGR